MKRAKIILKRLLKDKTMRLLIIVLVIMIVAGVCFAVYSATHKKTGPDLYEDPLQIAEDGTITGEGCLGYSEKDLVDRKYYILHKGKFYPTMETATINFDGTKETKYSSSSRVIMTTPKNSGKIPTLYLGEGDSLVYYSSTSSASYVVLERFKDEGVSIGAYTFSANDYNGYYYLSIDSKKNKEKKSIYPNSSAYQLMRGLKAVNKDESERNNDEEKNLLYFTVTGIGGVPMSRDQISSTGIIKGLEEGKTYTMDIYAGTEYHKYEVEADTHFYTGMEAYAIADVPLEKNKYQSVTIPDYLKDGYYLIDNGGLIRIIRGTSYSTQTVLDERLLETYEESPKDMSENELEYLKYFGRVISADRYSEHPKLNCYHPKNEGSFGYQSEEEQKEKEASKREQAIKDISKDKTPGTPEGEVKTSDSDGNKTSGRESNNEDNNTSTSSSSSSSQVSSSSEQRTRQE